MRLAPVTSARGTFSCQLRSKTTKEDIVGPCRHSCRRVFAPPQSTGGALQDLANLSSPRREAPPQRDPSPAESLYHDLHAPSHSPGAPHRRPRHSSPELPGFNSNDQQEYRFDELDGRNQQYADAGVDEDLLVEGESDGDEGKNMDNWDILYGLPHSDNPPEQEEHPFEMEWGNQGEPDDPEPEGPINPASRQKVLYRANHRALTHQLKAAQRQLRSNPNVPVEELARMALTIRAVERRLGLDSGDTITTYTLCPLCRRSYHPDYIVDAIDNTCQNNGCARVLYDIKTLADNSGIAELVLQNRRTDDDHELDEPISVEG